MSNYNFSSNCELEGINFSSNFGSSYKKLPCTAAEELLFTILGSRSDQNNQWCNGIKKQKKRQDISGK